MPIHITSVLMSLFVMFKVIVILISFFFSQHVLADSFNVIINGKAVHENKRNYNEDNWGLGFEYDFAEDKKWINFVNGGFFKDSLSNTSKYFGGGSKRRYLLGDDIDGWHIDAGISAFLMTRKDYKNERPFVGVLPFVSVGTSKFAINATFIPAVSPKTESLWFFQALVQVAAW